ncbi:hypothetical protein ACOJQI_21670 [Bacillus salacetis]|uniref:hypothetical protein n=1 Tax=Bacillus salacetis TaxID=2315464 RepID=UPI003B9F18C7
MSGFRTLIKQFIIINLIHLNNEQRERGVKVYKKNCQRCGRSSYSAVESGEWKCPYCGIDLAGTPFFNPTSFNQINQRVIPLKEKLHTYSKSFLCRTPSVRQKPYK